MEALLGEYGPQLATGLAWVATGGIGLKAFEFFLQRVPRQEDAASKFREAVLKELEGKRLENARLIAERNTAYDERDRWHDRATSLREGLSAARERLEDAEEALARAVGDQRLSEAEAARWQGKTAAVRVQLAEARAALEISVDSLAQARKG